MKNSAFIQTDLAENPHRDSSSPQIPVGHLVAAGQSVEKSLVDTPTRLETMDGRLRTQQQKLDLKHQLYLHTVQEIRSQVRSQDQRLNWTMMAAVFVMTLGSAAGGYSSGMYREMPEFLAVSVWK